MRNQAQIFRDLVARPQGVFGFGVADAFDAMIAELAGSECIYAGGYSAAASRGWPDMGIMTGVEMLYNVQGITRATKLPTIADIDDGYGGIHNVIRTTEEFLGLTEVAGIHFEDQEFPKRCGHIRGKKIKPFEEIIGRFKAVIEVRNRVNPNAFIIYRTDAFSAAGGNKDPVLGGDMIESIQRGRAAADLGADSLWCEFPTLSRATAEAFAEGIYKRHPGLPLSFNWSPSFNMHQEKDLLTFEELNQMGYKFIFSTYPALKTRAVAVYEMAKEFKEKNGQALIDLMAKTYDHPAYSIMRLIGVAKYQTIEQAYSPEARERFQTSEGFSDKDKK